MLKIKVDGLYAKYTICVLLFNGKMWPENVNIFQISEKKSPNYGVIHLYYSNQTNTQSQSRSKSNWNTGVHKTQLQLKLREGRQKITESVWGSSLVSLAVLCWLWAVWVNDGATHENNLQVSWKSHLISRNPGQIFRKGKALFFNWTVRSQS